MRADDYERLVALSKTFDGVIADVETRRPLTAFLAKHHAHFKRIRSLHLTADELAVLCKCTSALIRILENGYAPKTFSSPRIVRIVAMYLELQKFRNRDVPDEPMILYPEEPANGLVR